MSKNKEKLIKIFFAISKKKWMYFGILTVLLIFFSIQAIRYSDIVIWDNMPKYFIKPQKADMLLYNLSVSYIVSYMFYILVNFIPDFVEAIEKENKTLPFKASMQREVQQFTSDIVDLWTIIGINASIKGEFHISKTDSINDFFNLSVIQAISEYVRLEELIEDYIDVNVLDIHYIWSTKIRYQLDKVYTLGNLILTRYKDNIPSEIFYDIFYIINESKMAGALLSELNVIALLRNGRNFRLSSCINFTNDNGKIDINQSCQSIINLYNWVNRQYDYIANNINDNNIKINKIDIQSFLQYRYDHILKSFLIQK